MARTPSTMLELGSTLPNFYLNDGLQSASVALSDLVQEKGLVVMFICNHCPFVLHVKDEIKKLAKWAIENGVGVVAINSNDVQNYPDDHPLKMRDEGYSFPYLFDESQDVAKAFRAACTPDFYLFNGQKKLVYRGQLDDSRPGNDEAINGKDLREAISALLKNHQISEIDQKPSLGCNIKWKEGAAPDYFGA